MEKWRKRRKRRRSRVLGFILFFVQIWTHFSEMCPFGSKHELNKFVLHEREKKKKKRKQAIYT